MSVEPYGTVIENSAGFTVDIIIPWHARLYRVVWHQSYPYTSNIPVTTCTASNTGDVPINNVYGGMRVLESTNHYVYDYAYNDIPNTTVYNTATTGGYVNRISVKFYQADGTAYSMSGYNGSLGLVYCFDDDDPTYDDMLANCSPSSAISVVSENWSPTTRGYEHWYVDNDGTLPYLQCWDDLYPPFKLYIGDDPVTTMYFREHLAKVYIGDTLC